MNDFRLTAHHPLLGDNQGHPVGLSLFENDIAVLKFENEEDMKCIPQDLDDANNGEPRGSEEQKPSQWS